MYRITNPKSVIISFDLDGERICINPGESVTLNSKPSVNDLIIENLESKSGRIKK